MDIKKTYERLCRLFERELGERPSETKGNQMPSLQSRLLADKVMDVLKDEGFEAPELDAIKEHLGCGGREC